jgi:hypothetical protein
MPDLDTTPDPDPETILETRPPDFEERGTEEQLAALYAAMAQAVGEFPEIPKKGHVHFRDVDYWYARLADINSATDKPLSKHGLWCPTPFTMSEEEGANIRVMITHKAGGRIIARIKFKPQGEIKTLLGQTTYLRRGGKSALLGIEGVEETAEESPDQVSQSVPEPTKKKAPKRRRPPAPPKKAPQSPQAAPPVDDEPPPPTDDDAPISTAAPTPDPDEETVDGDDSGECGDDTRLAIGEIMLELGLNKMQGHQLCEEVTGTTADKITEDQGRALLKHLEGMGQ